ncbi:hypothetical protein [Marinicella sp. W31]|uniref:hypothetical protein n=1 Tax=Marinicella sp. W31 TaxID=3023713 RepID=UPI003757FA1E
MTHRDLIRKYLDTYAEDESRCTWDFQSEWDSVLCVPICGESANCIEQMLAACVQKNVLVIAVINQPQEHPKAHGWQQQNQALMSHMTKLAKSTVSIRENMRLLGFDSGLSCLMIDRSSHHPIATKQGVGLARKIAADMALRLIHEGIIATPWIFSTDADVQLPADYFEAVKKQDAAKVSALCLPFQHCIDDQPWSLQQHLYDFKLYYYQAGIRFAGAGYDYIPLGSTLVISALAYAQVRGFPTRNGAEDFYILNKLAKLGRIEQPQGFLVSIQSRLSERVPFGTGPAVQALMQQSNAVQQPLYYHPKCFHYLKRWQQYLRGFWQQRELPEDDSVKTLFETFNLQSVFDKTLPHIRNETRWNQFVHEWLDAFRLLKSVHFLSEKLPLVNLQELLSIQEFSSIDVDGILNQQGQMILAASRK